MLRSFALALLAAAVVAAPASAATNFGSSLADTADNSYNCIASETCAIVQNELAASHVAAGGLFAPTGGVITSIRVKMGPATAALQFRVLRPGSGGTFTGIFTSAAVTPPLNASTSYPMRIPVLTADRVGYQSSGEPELFHNLSAEVGTDHIFEGGAGTPIPDGATATPDSTNGCSPITGGCNFGYEVLIRATLEPDADHDGFGDDTQDPCLGVTGTLDGCVNPPPPPPVITAAPFTGTVKLGALKVDKKKGTAKLSVTVNSAGTVRAVGTTIKPATATAKGPGTVTLTLKGTSKTAKKLRSKHKAKVSITVGFTPASGAAASATKSLTLKKTH